jgi:hypothetical protein
MYIDTIPTIHKQHNNYNKGTQQALKNLTKIYK